MDNISAITEIELRDVINDCFEGEGKEGGANTRESFINMLKDNNDVVRYITACESGDETGEPFSPMDWLIEMFEKNYLDEETCSVQQIRDIVAVYNEMWYAAERYLSEKR